MIYERYTKVGIFLGGWEGEVLAKLYRGDYKLYLKKNQAPSPWWARDTSNVSSILTCPTLESCILCICMKLRYSFVLNFLHIFHKNIYNGVFTGVFTCQHVACEEAGRAAYSQLRLHVTGEYNRQVSVVKPQNMLHKRVHSYSFLRSQELEISSV